MSRTRLYRNGKLELENFPVADISDHLRDSACVVWLDMCAPSETDLAAIKEEFDLHELAIEDAIQEHERPKLDRYDDHEFLTAYAVRLDSETGELHTSELDAFITERALITVRADAKFDVEEVRQRWDASPELAKEGVGFLLHGIVDYIVDGHYAALQALDDGIEALEDQVFEDGAKDTDMQRRALRLRKSLSHLRKLTLPMREVMTTLMRDRRVADTALLHYYQDVYDHVLRVIDWTESLRETVANIRETQLNIQSQRLNVTMKKLTGWAAIIAVPTAVTGFYGQNVPYPGFQQPWGFWFSTILLLVLAGGLYIAFKRRDWL